MATSAAATRVYAQDYSLVFDAVCRAIPDARMKFLSADPATGAISAGSSVSMSTWGERVDIHVGQSAPGQVQVSIRSGLKFGLMDWGKNQKNVDRLLASIDQAIGAAASGAAASGAWHPDPTGRHEHRWWNGTTWTDQVADGGVAATDPL